MSAQVSLAEIFAAAAGRAAGASPHVAAVLAAALADARGAHPAIAVDDEAFVRHLALVASGDVDVVSSLRAGELYLSFAAGQGDASAIAEIERRYLPQAISAVARLTTSAAEQDDIAQLLRRRLFVRETEDLPRIAAYRGRGSLGGFLRTVAVRVALGHKREARREEQVSADDDVLLDMPGGAYPELEHARARYREELKAAFEAALAGLSTRERNLLRLHFIDGMSIDQAALVYHVHRSTVARWIARAREALADETHRILGERLGLQPSELTSVVALVRSQLDISIHRYLKAEDE